MKRCIGFPSSSSSSSSFFLSLLSFFPRLFLRYRFRLLHVLARIFTSSRCVVFVEIEIRSFLLTPGFNFRATMWIARDPIEFLRKWAFIFLIPAAIYKVRVTSFSYICLYNYLCKPRHHSTYIWFHQRVDVFVSIVTVNEHSSSVNFATFSKYINIESEFC